MRRPASQGSKLAGKGFYLNATDRRLQVQLTQKAKIALGFPSYLGNFCVCWLCQRSETSPPDEVCRPRLHCQPHRAWQMRRGNRNCLCSLFSPGYFCACVLCALTTARFSTAALFFGAIKGRSSQFRGNFPRPRKAHFSSLAAYRPAAPPRGENGIFGMLWPPCLSRLRRQAAHCRGETAARQTPQR